MLLVSATFLLPASASAHKKVWDTTTTAGQREQHEGGTVFEGTLSSPKPACVKGRPLNVFENPWEPANEPNYEEWDGSPIVADDFGYWSFEVPNRNTWRYYVRAPRERLARAGHRHFCGGFTSDVLEVFAPG
jgi:hypothetical protein